MRGALVVASPDSALRRHIAGAPGLEPVDALDDTFAGPPPPAVLVPEELLRATGGFDWLDRTRRRGAAAAVVVLTDAGSERLVLELGVDACASPSADPLVLLRIAREASAARVRLVGRTASPARGVILLCGTDAEAVDAMTEAGHKVERGGDDLETLARIRRGDVAAIVFRPGAGALPGLELLTAARRFDPTLATVVLTADTVPGLLLDALRSGDHAVVTRPVDPRRLQGTMAKAIAERQARTAARQRAVAAAGTTCHVLLAIADVNLSRTVATGLEGTGPGWEIAIARTALAAMDRLRDERFDLVVVDTSLDGGPSSAAAVQAGSRDAAVIVLADGEDTEAIERLFLAGIQEILPRAALTADLLRQRVRYAMERRQLLAKLDELVLDLRASDLSRLRLIERHTEAIIVLGEDGHILTANPSAETLFGRPAVDLVGLLLGVPSVADGAGEIEILRPSGEVRIGELRAARTTWEDRPAWLVSIRDTTRGAAAADKLEQLSRQLAEANKKLERMVTLDPLTGITNRRGLETALQRELEGARRSGSSTVACLVDCDDFKSVNDRYGHAAGDMVLRTVAERLTQATRGSDVVARIGGDEFLILLPRTRLAEARMLAERARLAVSSEPIITSSDAVRTSVSVGVSTLEWDTTSIEEILSLTRLSLKASKDAGKNRVVGDEAGLRIHELIRGLVTGAGIRPHAQPIVRLSDQTVVGYELLSRGPVGPFAAPLQFLRIARDREVITAVDLQCLKACLSAASALPIGTSVHVNLLPTTLLDVPLEELDRIFDVVDARAVCLELSEDQFIGDPEELVKRIGLLKQAGVSLAIDDLGKGRGTLESVMLLDPEVAKIDRSLVDGAARDMRKERLLERLVRLTRVLDCRLIAEGIEQPEDAALLASLGVQYAQGFIWSPPVAVDEAPTGSVRQKPERLADVISLRGVLDKDD